MSTPSYLHTDARPVTLATLGRMKHSGEKIACLTAYDASFAALEDRNGVDVVLVGDSLGMVVQGHKTTLGTTIEDMVYHSRITAAGLSRAFLMADMPFLSYVSEHAALETARRLMGQGAAQMVKLEGGAVLAGVVEALAARGVPVCAHIGLQPQQVHKLGGYRVQGRDEHMAASIREDARVLEAAGADVLLLECLPSAIGAAVAAAARVPVIGIGAGPDTDGQILVLYDILGLSPGPGPRFARDFLRDTGSLDAAAAGFVAAVKNGGYPNADESF